jgi:hypothetical protein
LLGYPEDGECSGLGQSVEGDSTLVTLTYLEAIDSAQAIFSFGESAGYVTMSLLPIAGTSNDVLVSDAKMDLDSIGLHFVLIEVWNGDAIVDTVVGTWYHDAVYLVQAYLGAGEGMYQILYPRDGSANKDSVIVVDGRRPGDDSLVAKIRWHHINDASVYDSSYAFFLFSWGP